MKKILLVPIRFYRKYISRMKALPCCRFTPCCSEYAYRAVDEWGFVIGFLLAVFRILRCSPLFRGGRDEVPRRPRKLIPATRELSFKLVKGKVSVYFPYLTRMGTVLEEDDTENGI